MQLKIISWNMWCFNKNPNDAFNFIANLDADIICLQEVPADFLERLHTLDYHIATSTDFTWITDPANKMPETATCHLAILSKQPLSNIVVREADVLMFESLQYKLFRSLMHRLAGWAGPTIARGILQADTTYHDMPVRIYSIHPPLYNATIRTAELFRVFSNLRDTAVNIVCGDFNILDHWAMKPLNWLIGSTFSQMLPWFNERREKETLFSKAGLTNPLIGSRTQVIAHAQLDHILVPIGTHVLEKQVFADTHGSDHNPVMVRVEM